LLEPEPADEEGGGPNKVRGKLATEAKENTHFKYSLLAESESHYTHYLLGERVEATHRSIIHKK
jgi:hypothetical protein